MKKVLTYIVIFMTVLSSSYGLATIAGIGFASIVMGCTYSPTPEGFVKLYVSASRVSEQVVLSDGTCADIIISSVCTTTTDTCNTTASSIKVQCKGDAGK